MGGKYFSVAAAVVDIIAGSVRGQGGDFERRKIASLQWELNGLNHKMSTMPARLGDSPVGPRQMGPELEF